MSCFFFYFKPMGLYSGGLIHGLMFTLVTGVGLYEDGLILGWAYPWQFTVSLTPIRTCDCRGQEALVFEKFLK